MDVTLEHFWNKVGALILLVAGEKMWILPFLPSKNKAPATVDAKLTSYKEVRLNPSKVTSTIISVIDSYFYIDINIKGKNDSNSF